MEKGRFRIFAGIGALLLVAAPATVTFAHNPARTASNQNERMGIEIVRQWTDAFTRKDVNRVLSYMSDDVAFYVDASKRYRGKEELRKELEFLFPVIDDVKTPRIYAVGGPREVMIITERVDVVTMKGKTITVKVGAFFRIDPQTGKIIEWIEQPLAKVDFGS